MSSDRTERLLDTLCAHCDVGRVDEARIDLTTGDIVERLTDVLREDELGLERSQRPRAFKLSSAYWPTGTVFGLPMTIRLTRESARSAAC